MKRSGHFRLVAHALLALLLLLPLSIWPPRATALKITNKSISITTAVPSAIADYTISLTYPSTSTVGSLSFDFCANSPLFDQPCTVPAGLDLSPSSFASQTGNVGFSVDNGNSTSNRYVLTRTAAAGLMVNSSYLFTGVTNPSGVNTTTYVRIATYPTTDASGPMTDFGGAAFATVGNYQVDAFVPPFIKLCVALVVAPDCSSASGNHIDLGLLSPTNAKAASSQFACGTNDPSGYVISMLGATMTAGNNVIPAITTPTPSLTGVGQFGINLRQNSLPPVGSEPAGAGTATVAADYNVPNFYVFRVGDTIATSVLPTDYNNMTVSYIVNIPTKQPIGRYTTTVTYVATVQF